MFGKLFQKREKRPTGSQDETIGSASVGDVFTVSGFGLEYEESYFIIEKKNRYAGSSAEWFEVLGVDDDKRLWVEWSGAGDRSVSVRADARPVGLDSVGVTTDELIRMDEKHSIDSYIDSQGTRYQYENSGEASYFEDDMGEGAGFYLWEFASDDGARILSVVKWDDMPFQIYISEVVSADRLSVYKR